MNTIIGSYSHFEKRLLTAAYFTANRLDQDRVTIDEILEEFDFDIPIRFAKTALKDFRDQGLSKESMHNGTLGEQRIWLSAEGLREAERQIENRETDIQEFARKNTVVPAADRLVTLSHNSEDHSRIKSELSEIAEAVRTTNSPDIEPEERARVLHSIEYAATLWDTTQLKAIQVKVGVLLAAEDAAKLLVGTAKAVAAALLVDAIKSFVKSHAGLDLDNL